jgi:lysophospholipase L1-like esterase
MRSQLVRGAAAALLILVCALLVQAQPAFHLRPNDTVVFYGDSITDQRLYTTFVETFVVTRYPSLPVRFVHSGWGGDRVSGGGGGPVDERLKRDVLAYKPTVMTIMLGMNDGRYRVFDSEIFREYSTGYEHMLDFVKAGAPDIRFTLIQPSPFDDVTRPPTVEGGYNAVLVRYGEFLKDLAQKRGALVADLNTPVVESLRRAFQTDAKLAERIVPDRVHPGPAGHLLMAAALLKAWGAAPLVSRVVIDAGAGTVTESVNATVTGIQKGAGISWNQLDTALPMPVNMNDPVIALAVKSSDLVETLNQQTLRVTGLTGTSYTLKINGAAVGTFTGAQLASGINLAELPTPMAKQAAGVHALTLKRADVHNTRWRQLQVPFQNETLPRMQSIISNLDALDEELAVRQRAAAQPSSCFYELIP